MARRSIVLLFKTPSPSIGDGDSILPLPWLRRPIRCSLTIHSAQSTKAIIFPILVFFLSFSCLPLSPSHHCYRDHTRDSSSGSDSSIIATENYVDVSNTNHPVAVVAVAAVEQAVLNPNPCFRTDSEFPEALAWSSIEEKAYASVAIYDKVLGRLGGPVMVSVGGGEKQKRVLPEELSKGAMILKCRSSTEGGTCNVYLARMAHVS